MRAAARLKVRQNLRMVRDFTFCKATIGFARALSENFHRVRANFFGARFAGAAHCGSFASVFLGEASLAWANRAVFSGWEDGGKPPHSKKVRAIFFGGFQHHVERVRRGHFSNDLDFQFEDLAIADRKCAQWLFGIWQRRTDEIREVRVIGLLDVARRRLVLAVWVRVVNSQQLQARGTDLSRQLK